MCWARWQKLYIWGDARHQRDQLHRRQDDRYNKILIHLITFSFVAGYIHALSNNTHLKESIDYFKKKCDGTRVSPCYLYVSSLCIGPH